MFPTTVIYVFILFMESVVSLSTDTVHSHINKNHVIINLCGWPQSGTSLTHEVLHKVYTTALTRFNIIETDNNIWRMWYLL